LFNYYGGVQGSDVSGDEGEAGEGGSGVGGIGADGPVFWVFHGL